MKLDESCISNPKSEISNWTRTAPEAELAVQSKISDFGFEVQDSSNFTISLDLFLTQSTLNVARFCPAVTIPPFAQ